MRTHFYFACFLLLLMPKGGEARTTDFNPRVDTLVVALAGSAPFLVETRDAEDPEGIAVEIWEKIADKEKWSYTYKYYDSVSSALQSLRDSTVDVVAGPISITAERVENFGFSQPYFQSSLSIMSRVDEPSFWQKIKPFFSLKLLIAVASFVFILAIVGTLFWIVEHHSSPDQFPKDPVKGIGNGMWLAIVTMSTTGYGDMAPVTLKGRIVAGVWMVVTIIFATSMVAGIASTLTLSSLGNNTITNIEQLSKKKVATVAGSPTELFLEDHHIQEVAVTTLDEAIDKLENHEVEAVIYDRPQMRYYMKNNSNKNLYLAKAEYYRQGYGFAFQLKSPLIYNVNRTLLTLAEDRATERIFDFYLGNQNE